MQSIEISQFLFFFIETTTDIEKEFILKKIPALVESRDLRFTESEFVISNHHQVLCKYLLYHLVVSF